MPSSPRSKETNGGMATLLSLLRVTKSEEEKAAAGVTEDVAEKKVEWLRSQLIGQGVEFDTPFGRRLLTYADQTASGRSILYIEDYIVKEVLPFYGNTHTEDSHVGSKTTRLVHKAARYIKRCMGAGPDDALLFCGAGTTAAIKRLQEVMGVALPSAELRRRLASQLRAEERWVVFVGPYEHHSNLLSWRQSLAEEVVEIGVDADGLIDIAALRRALGSPEYKNRPMLGSFSACSNVTGIVTDTRELARVFARARRLRVLRLRRKLNSQPPSTCGGGTVVYVNGFDEEDTLYYDGIEEREDAGTPPIIQKIRASLAFWLKEYIGYHNMGLREQVYTEMVMKMLGFNGLKPGWTRLSFAYYLSKDELKFILAAIEFIAEYGHRFLPLFKTKRNPENNHMKFERYLESAKIIALSLPNISQHTVDLPKGIDTDMVLFHI
ncbi:hypothetical protein PR202_ga03817 [Eleusine coracana subsp. coracana]|uniref:Aminotransferase class V domain-containing protein n=1 Tax=Eleusine coracana subsp. coracana TaxID=191504 RepID=A0AAV5BNE2_ELECO|nr:hypothetical protein PR202_ga03817 [Eleusine coracana subsp. coracana]